MSDRPPSAVEQLWRHDQFDPPPRQGLSLERVVHSGVELADDAGLAAVSMKRVAERLGFTTMSLYRYVASKDELLLHMHDTVWRPPPGLDAPPDDWRTGVRRWTWEQHLTMQRHPWLDEVRFIDRAGTPSQVAWLELGLGALTGTPLTERVKVSVLLLLGGYVSSHARLANAAVEGTRQGLYSEPHQVTELLGELLRTVVTVERFPALHAAVLGGAFVDVAEPTYAPFEFGLDLMLNGIDDLMAKNGLTAPPAG